MKRCFEIKNLSFYYPGQAGAALKNLSFSVAQGEFVVLAGPSGCGKSTLLRQLKSALTPHGIQTGEICFEGVPLGGVAPRDQAARIGFVQQSPENQIVTDKVWHELAFGLESLGFSTPAIRARVAEMASFFGIEGWFYRDVAQLSGGQKQLLNLASVMAMGPSALILDEPTSQLDPIAAGEFLAVLGKINRDLGTTIILSEHRLEEVLPLADRVLVLDGGRLVADGPPREAGEGLRAAGHAMFLAMPTPMRVWAAVPGPGPAPITVREGRAWLGERAATRPPAALPPPAVANAAGDAAVTLDGVWFKYEKNAPDVLRGLSLTARKGEFLALLGGNGTGKTTALSVIAGLRRPYRGELRVAGRLALLPQNPQTLFVKKNLREDLYELFEGGGVPRAEQDARVARAVGLCRLEPLLGRHPYDLSGGEQQRAALAKVLLLEPEILLLDEPTKGLDAEFKQALAAILKALQAQGVTLLMVSHDVEFCAEHAGRCALFFDGGVVTSGPPRAFFSGNSFYTTAANRMARGLLPEAVTAADIITACGGAPPPPPPQGPHPDTPPLAAQEAPAGRPAKLPAWRRLVAAASGLTAAAVFVKALGLTDLTAHLTPGGTAGAAGAYGALTLLAALLALALAAFRRVPPAVRPVAPPKKSRLPRHTLAAAGTVLLLVPLTLLAGAHFWGGRKYYFIALLILLEVMVPFVLAFEGRRPQARELVVVAVLCALGVAGRAALFMLPEFKPVTALVILSGVAFGGETGFLVGAATMLASNMLFGQGPWTPWQMFAMGLIGFLAGLIFRRGRWGRGRLALCVYGALASVVIYGGIMNPASALLWAPNPSAQTVLAYFVTGLPVDLIRAAATALFLWFGAEPMLEKLDRIKVKYGLVA